MAGDIVSLEPVDESVEQWSSYTQCFNYFVTANGIADDKIVPTFLSVMGPKFFNLLCNLLQPVKPGMKNIQINCGHTYNPFFTQASGDLRSHSDFTDVTKWRVSLLPWLWQHLEISLTLWT